MKKKLEDKFNNIPERVITMALETAEYDEERAERFLNSTAKEDNHTQLEEDSGFDR